MPSITGRYEKTKRPIVERIKSHAYLLVKNALRASALVGSPSTFSSRNFLVAAKMMKMMIPIIVRSAMHAYVRPIRIVAVNASG